MAAWTPEMDAVITTGFEVGLSARIIGEQLGMTRNSVLGRSFRLGLSKPKGDGTKALGLAARACGFTVADLEEMRLDMEQDGLL